MNNSQYIIFHITLCPLSQLFNHSNRTLYNLPVRLLRSFRLELLKIEFYIYACIRAAATAAHLPLFCDINLSALITFSHESPLNDRRTCDMCIYV